MSDRPKCRVLSYVILALIVLIVGVNICFWGYGYPLLRKHRSVTKDTCILVDRSLTGKVATRSWYVPSLNETHIDWETGRYVDDHSIDTRLYHYYKEYKVNDTKTCYYRKKSERFTIFWFNGSPYQIYYWIWIPSLCLAIGVGVVIILPAILMIESKCGKRKSENTATTIEIELEKGNTPKI